MVEMGAALARGDARRGHRCLLRRCCRADAAINSAVMAMTTTDANWRTTPGLTVAGGGDGAPLALLNVASGGIDAELLGAADDDVAADISDDAAAAADRRGSHLGCWRSSVAIAEEG